MNPFHAIFNYLFIAGPSLLLAIFCIRRFTRGHPSSVQAKHREIEQSEQDYGIPCRTIRGERVRSKAECFIANYLNTRGIKYLYEEPFRIEKKQETIELHPDFYLPELDLLIEYWGLIHVSREYAEEMNWKMSLYHRSQIRFISIYPENVPYPFDPVDFDRMFQHKFQKVTGVALRSLAREELAAMPHYEVITRLESKRLSRST